MLKRVLLVVAVSVLGIIALKVGSGGPPAKQRPILGASQPSEPLSPLGYWEEGRIVWQEAEYRQTLYITGFDYVDVVDEFYDAATDQWLEVHNHGGASFRILHMASAGPDVFACGGFAANGEIVLQKWKLNRSGVPELEPVPYGSPPQAPPSVGFRKVEVFRGPLATNLYGIGLDPQGRYMLVLTGTSASAETLYKFGLQAGTTPVVVANVASLPELAQVSNLKLMDHVQLGRACVMDAGFDGDFQVILTDGDNDGVFEGAPLVGDYAFFTQQGLDTYEDWDAFMHP